jgi:hypothetical protein
MFTLIHEEPDQFLYQYRSLLVNIHWNELQLAHLQSITRACEKLTDEHKQMTSLIVLRGAVNVDLSNDARKAGANLTMRFEKLSVGQAVVVEASGFMASMARSVITGINLIARAKSPQRVFQDPREATEWLCGLPAQPPDLRTGLPKLWPAIEALLRERSRADTGPPRIASST